MRCLWRGWYAVSCILALIVARSIPHKDKAYLRAKLSSLESLDVEDIPEDTFEEIIEDYETLRPIPTPRKNRLVAKPLALEPDAEMLPVHYKGVKPPGVDHMEMISVDPDTLRSRHLSNTADQASKIESVANVLGKKKSNHEKKVDKKESRVDQVKISRKPKKRDPQKEDRDGYLDESKRKIHLEKNDEGQDKNYQWFGSPSTGESTYTDKASKEARSNDENLKHVRLGRGNFFRSFELSEEDASNGNKRDF